MVANKPLYTPPSPMISSLVVPGGYDVADRYIADNLIPGDLVITADIPLASDVIKNGGFALNPRGEMYTAENIQERLSLRNFMENLRNSGVETGGPGELGKGDRQTFANSLDTFLRERSADK